MEDSMTIIYMAVAVAMGCLGVFVGFLLKKKMDSGLMKGAKTEAESLVSRAEKDAETVAREAEIKAKDIMFQAKQDADKDSIERKKEFQSLENRLNQKEETIDKKFETIDKKTEDLDKREESLNNFKVEVEKKSIDFDHIIAEEKNKLESISGMNREDAKKELLDVMESEAKLEAGKTLKRIEEEIKSDSDERAKEIICTAIQRYAGSYVVERTVSVVQLPSDDMKGRIIGREGRNIRALESITGIDVIIDDTPEAVILSGHNAIRREIAKISLERLLEDGRIHPARIEEVVAKVETEVMEGIMEAGEKAMFDCGLHGVHKEIQKLVGKLKYRHSYTQNVYAHSMEVGFICGAMAAELGIDTMTARRAGLLHDIGKAVDHEVEGAHAVIGGELAKKYGENQTIVDAIGQHHDSEPVSYLGVLVQAADAISAARPGARSEMVENYVKRIDELEQIATSFDGVSRSYALQAGREVRVMVESGAMTDESALLLSKDIAKKIETELSYPGQIKITVIRESRAVEYAR